MITSVSNAKIKNVMQLNQKAKARREQGLWAEGRKMFLKHRKAGFPGVCLETVLGMES